MIGRSTWGSPVRIDFNVTPVFAYLRRSTSKKEQEDSLLQQKDGVNSIIKKLGLKTEKVRYFIETESWFENTNRKEWGKMLDEIDRSPRQVVVLCRDFSRLTRNPTDGQKIMDRLYGDNSLKWKVKIAKIFTLEYGEIKTWDKSTDKEDIHRILSAAYYDSLDTRKKSIGGILMKLENGEFPYHPPRGLKHILWKDKRILKQDDKMPFVRHAFEMKAEKRGHKEISQYLKQYGGIKIGYKELTDRYFANIVYIGRYIEKNTNRKFDRILFFEGKPPISDTLWDRVQNTLGKRGRTYRNESEKDIFEEKWKTSLGGLLARDIKKGKHVYYKNTKAKVNISQKLIIEAFNQKICDLIWVFYHQYRKNMTLNRVKTTGQNEKNQLKNLLDYGTTNTFLKRLERKNVEWTIKKHEMKTLDFLRHMKLAREDALDFFKKLILGTESSRTKSEEKEARTAEIGKLKEQQKKLEQEKNEYRKKAVLLDFSKQEIDEVTDDLDKSINLIKESIGQFSDNSPFEDFIERLPLILLEIVELVDGALNEEKIEERKKNILALFEITVSNFSVSNKKELKIKLFDVLDRVIMSGNSVLEAPAGVEPASRALQAPVWPFYQGAVSSIKSEKLKKKNWKELLF